jgi:glucosamine-6-phosphate deaminase
MFRILRKKVKAKTMEMKSFQKDKLNIEIHETKQSLGFRAANYASEKLANIINKKGSANLILATGASQFEFLAALKKIDAIDWSKIAVFHLDEYLNMPDTHPASFRKYLKERILDEVKPAIVNFLRGDAQDIEKEIERYENLLKNHPIDLACIGIGENGHIAFNDPPVADFNDPKLVKMVALDEPCRRQQFGEGWFKTYEDVPKTALSLTIPAIMGAKNISCVVPDKRKATAVYNAINGPISVACPASILRTHANATLFLDAPAASKLS